MKRLILLTLAVVFVTACFLPAAAPVPMAAAFESPLQEESPLFAAQAESPLPTSTSVFHIVLPTVTPKPLPTMPPLGIDAPAGETPVYRLLAFPVSSGDDGN